MGESGYPHKTPPPSPKHTHTVCTQLDSFSWRQSETAARQLLHCASSQPTVEDYTTYQKVFIHRRVCLITKAQRLHSLMSPGSNFRETERGLSSKYCFYDFELPNILPQSCSPLSMHTYVNLQNLKVISLTTIMMAPLKVIIHYSFRYISNMAQASMVQTAIRC